MSASRVRAGQVFVEIGADPTKFFATLGRLNKAMGSIGQNLTSVGARMAGIGAGMAAPIVASVNAGTKFENVLLGIRASTGATQEQIDRIKASSMAMSQALGVGPTEAAAGMLELLKAGMSVEGVLGGAGQAALQFAKVGNMDVGEAAVVMADAMNVFKVSGEVAANTLSAAADSSSTSIELITQSFSQVSAVAALANQSIQDTAAAIAVMANAGIKGSDAGTSLKTMLSRLMAPAEDAAAAMESVGLSTQSFRNADGTMKPMVEIIRTLNSALAGMDQAAKDDIFRRMFGSDAIRAAAVLTSAGVEGFGAMRQSMSGAMSVGDKYATMQSGMAGATRTLMASLERLAITISDAVGPAVLSIAKAITPVLDGFGKFIANNKAAVTVFAGVAASVVAIGVSLAGLGITLRAASAAFAGFGIAAQAVTIVGVAAASAVGGFSALGSAVYAAGSTAAAGISSVLSFGAALGGVFASQFRIATFIGQSFGGAIVTALSKTAGALSGMIGATSASAVAFRALSEFASTAAGAVMQIGMTAFEAGRVTVTALSAAAVSALALARSAGQTVAALFLAGTTAVASSALTLAAVGKSTVATLAYAATSISSAAATAAAWAVANASLLAIVGIIGAAVFAFSQLFKVAFEVGSWMKDGFAGAVSDSFVVFADMKRIAMDAFSAISDAFAAGDMELAMKAAMVGVLTEFQRGANALLSKTSEFSANLLNVIDAYTTSLRQPFILTSSKDPEVERERRALEQRQQERLMKAQDPGKGGQALSELEARLGTIKQEAATKRADKDIATAAADRLSTSKNTLDVDLARQQIAGLLDRGNLTAEAEQKLVDEFQKKWAEMSQGPAAVVAPVISPQMTGLGPAGLSPESYAISAGIGGVKNLKDLGEFGKQISKLLETDKLSMEEEDQLLKSYREAQNRIAEQDRMRGGGESQSRAEVAGTFSSMALGGMGFGSSLAERQLNELKGIHGELKKDNEDKVAA